MKSSSRARSYRQCFLCREWSWSVCGSTPGVVGVELCLPCYVDVLEVKQARGVMAPLGGRTPAHPVENPVTGGEKAGNSPSPFHQLDLFD